MIKSKMAAAAAGAPARRTRVGRGGWRNLSEGDLFRASALPLVWVALIVVFALIEPAKFLTTANLANILSTQAVSVIMALAVLLPLTAGDFDLSIASNAGLTAMLVAILDVQRHVPILACVVLALVLGTFIGVFNAALVLVLKVDAFIATLGIGTVLLGITLAISSQNTIVGISPALTTAVDGSVDGISYCFFAGLVLAAVLWYVMEHTITGRRVLFIGLSPVVSALSGIRVSRIRWMTFTVCGFLAGLGGIAYVGTLGAADPTSASSTFLLPAYAAAFLGATTITPGRFNAWGIVVSTYFLATGFTGLELLGVPDWVQQLFYGGILVIAVALANGRVRFRLVSRRALVNQDEDQEVAEDVAADGAGLPL
jgi:ribose transport system permease protein